MGNEFTYTVMYSKSKDGPWIPAHLYRLTDDNIDWLNSTEKHLGLPLYPLTDQNTFIITGLRSDEQYFVKVLSHDKYDQWWYSYNGKDSLEGGATSEIQPTPDGKNVIGFQFEVI